MSYSLEPDAMRKLVRVAQIVIDPADPGGVGDAEVFSNPRNAREILSQMTHGVQRGYLLDDEQIVDAYDTAVIDVATGDRRRLAVLGVVFPQGSFADDLGVDHGGAYGVVRSSHDY